MLGLRQGRDRLRGQERRWTEGYLTNKGGNLRKALGAREKPLRFALRQLLQKSPENFLLNVVRVPGLTEVPAALAVAGAVQAGIPGQGTLFLPRAPALREVLWAGEAACIRVWVPSLRVFLQSQSS